MEIIIENKKIIVSIEDNGDHYAPQWKLDDSQLSGFDVFTQLIGFINPIKALKDLGLAILAECKGLEKPVLFVGSNDKRTKVYAKMLKKHGINFDFTTEPCDGETALLIKF